MSGPDFAAVKAALAEVTDLDGVARVAWMAALAERDPALHAEVASLLEHEDDDEITGVIGDLGGRIVDALDPGVPEYIGPYRILEVLGKGGMGVVFRALQVEPLRREVAVKVLRGAAFDTIGAARFQTEATALARLDHPHIAAVYDAGIDATERPYLALQLVEGEPLLDACAHLPLRDRLEVFLDVCDAVRHAHQRGVVHRDLKPSNILVATRDGRPWAMVIDFGIARDAARVDATLTQQGQLVGTPAYMSPEQAGAFGGVVDTRTDVYALGIVLFELLTGSRLFEPTEISLDEIRSRTLTTALPRPSAAVTGSGIVAARQLQGDLDTIVAMALRPEPDRRYSSVEALADDLRNHLAGRPVAARGDSAGYLVGRFVRRHRGAVALGAVVALGLVGAAIVGVVQDLRVREQRDRAVAAEVVAVDQAEGAQEVAQFLVEMFAHADPAQTGGETITAREILDRGAERIDEELADRPVVRATLLEALGRSYHGLGEYDRAAELLNEAVALGDAHRQPDDPALRSALDLLAIIEHDRGDYDASLAAAGRALDLARASGDREQIARMANGVAVTLDALGRHVEAEALYRESLDMYRATLGDDDSEVAWAINTLAQARWRLGHYREALADWTDAEARARRALGDDHQDRAYVLNNLAAGKMMLGDPAGAEADWREALRIFEAVFGPEHAAVGRGLCNLSRAVSAQGRHDEAMDLSNRGVAIQRAALGEHRLTAGALMHRARNRAAAGDAEGAVADLEAAAEIASAIFGEEHRMNLEIAELRADLAHDRGEVEAAAEGLRAVLAARERAQGVDHPQAAQARAKLGGLLVEQGDCPGAWPLIDKALPVLGEQLGEGHEDTVAARMALAACE